MSVTFNSPGGVKNFADLSDVDLTGFVTGDGLERNSSGVWVPSKIVTAPTAGTAGNIPVFGAGGRIVEDSGISDDGTNIYVRSPLHVRSPNGTYSIGLYVNNFGSPPYFYSPDFSRWDFGNTNGTNYLSLDLGTAGTAIYSNYGGGTNHRFLGRVESVNAANPQVRLTHTAGSIFADIWVSATGACSISLPTSGYSLNMGLYSLSFGSSASAASHAAAFGTSVSAGLYSLAVGRTTTANQYSLAVGENISAGSHAVAIGRNVSASDREFVVGSAVGASSLLNAYWGAGKTHATPPADLNLNSTGGLGTDVSATDIWLAGGRPTGSGVGGKSGLRTAAPGATGTTLRNLVDRFWADTHGVCWVNAVSTAPTVGQSGQVGLFVEAGVLKVILPDNSVETIAFV